VRAWLRTSRAEACDVEAVIEEHLSRAHHVPVCACVRAPLCILLSLHLALALALALSLSVSLSPARARAFLPSLCAHVSACMRARVRAAWLRAYAEPESPVSPGITSTTSRTALVLPRPDRCSSLHGRCGALPCVRCTCHAVCLTGVRCAMRGARCRCCQLLHGEASLTNRARPALPGRSRGSTPLPTAARAARAESPECAHEHVHLVGVRAHDIIEHKT
jgi:hypothetical protein